MQRLIFWSGVIVSLLLGCGGQADPGASSSAGGTASGGFSAEPGGCNACQSLEQCWNGTLCVATMASLTAGYRIDVTEVTRSQYATWVATSPSTSGQGDACAWNASLLPDAACMAQSSVCQGTGCARHPVPCIDWCDAVAYCAAVDKRLCGRIGSGSVAPGFNSLNDAAQSEWYNACSSNGVNEFTYGNAAFWGICNDATSMVPTTVPVGTYLECQSPIPAYAGVFDLIGNVWEWENNCDGVIGATDRCNPRGTSFGISATMQTCSEDRYISRSAVSEDLGFRCCAP